MRSYGEDEQRKLKYDFKDLEGIIFGYKTSIDDKIKIMKIIEQKCEEQKRYDFSFYQAEPDERTGNMRISKLDLLKMQPSNI